jgi:hypothetical protein
MSILDFDGFLIWVSMDFWFGFCAAVLSRTAESPNRRTAEQPNSRAAESPNDASTHRPHYLNNASSHQPTDPIQNS